AVERVVLYALAGAEDALALVDEDDRLRGVARVGPQIAYPLCGTADVGRLEIRDRGGDELRARRLRERAREERLAGSRRPEQQQSARRGRMLRLEHREPLLQLGLAVRLE